MVPSLNPDIYTEVFRFAPIWDSVSLVQTHRVTYFEPSFWRIILFERSKIGPLACPVHIDIPSVGLAELRQIALLTALLQKNLSSPQPICRSLRCINMGAQDRVLKVIPGTRLLLSYYEDSLGSLLIIKCWDMMSSHGAEELARVEYSIEPGSGTHSDISAGISTQTSDHGGKYHFGFVKENRGALHLILLRVDYSGPGSVKLGEIAQRRIHCSRPLKGNMLNVHVYGPLVVLFGSIEPSWGSAEGNKILSFVTFFDIRKLDEDSAHCESIQLRNFWCRHPDSEVRLFRMPKDTILLDRGMLYGIFLAHERPTSFHLTQFAIPMSIPVGDPSEIELIPLQLQPPAQDEASPEPLRQYFYFVPSPLGQSDARYRLGAISGTTRSQPTAEETLEENHVFYDWTFCTLEPAIRAPSASTPCSSSHLVVQASACPTQALVSPTPPPILSPDHYSCSSFQVLFHGYSASESVVYLKLVTFNSRTGTATVHDMSLNALDLMPASNGHSYTGEVGVKSFHIDFRLGIVVLRIQADCAYYTRILSYA